MLIGPYSFINERSKLITRPLLHPPRRVHQKRSCPLIPCAEKYPLRLESLHAGPLFPQEHHLLPRTYRLPPIGKRHKLSTPLFMQCFEARELFKDLQPDLILVSPLQRALETCSLIFPDRKVPCIVEPLLSETFKHSSDICRSIELKKKQFPSFDFSPV